MVLYSDDVPYLPLTPCKKLETFNDPFRRKHSKTLNPPYSLIQDFCSEIPAISHFLLYGTLTRCNIPGEINKQSLRYLKKDQKQAN